MDSDSDVAIAPFDAVPPTLLRVIMLALPVDARGRAACVCPSWRAFLADPSLWQMLDLTHAGGVAAERVTENLMDGALKRAAGQLRVFTFNQRAKWITRDFLVAVIKSDGAQLQELNSGHLWLAVDDLKTLLAAAPRLQVLNVQVTGKYVELLPVLRNDPPYGPLRVSEVDAHGDVSDADVLAFAAAVSAHESLKGLDVCEVNFARGLNALVDAAAERRVSCFVMVECAFDAETVPALARLLQRGSLTTFLVEGNNFLDAQESSMPVLCAALRSCPTLTHLAIRLNPPDGASRHTAVIELLDAAALLPALTELDLNGSTVMEDFDDEDNVAFGCALGALLHANLPNLRTLRVNGCWLGDEGLAPVLDGLAANTHLRELNCRHDNNLSDAFLRNHLEPALTVLAARPALAE